MGVNLVFVAADVLAFALVAAVLVVGLWRHHVGSRLEVQLHDQGVADTQPPISVPARPRQQEREPLRLAS